jgi:hypothetical protein
MKRTADELFERREKVFATASATELIERKRNGGDCNQDESAWIKAYFDTGEPESDEWAALSDAYPIEYDEWGEELERGDRPKA